MEKWPRSLQLPGAPRGGQWVNKLNMFPGSLELYTEYISGKPMLNIFPGCLGLPGELPDAVHQDVLHAEVAWEAIIIRRRIYIIVVFVMITINAYIYIYICICNSYIYIYYGCSPCRGCLGEAAMTIRIQIIIIRRRRRI